MPDRLIEHLDFLYARVKRVDRSEFAESVLYFAKLALVAATVGVVFVLLLAMSALHGHAEKSWLERNDCVEVSSEPTQFAPVTAFANGVPTTTMVAIPGKTTYRCKGGIIERR